MPHKCIAVIPARGGSKRIPGKNIKPFNGRPIIEYSIASARDAACFDEVMVSTDDPAISAVAAAAGASLPFLRSAANSDDFATLADVCLEVLADYSARGQNFDLLCCILPTAPFVTSTRLLQGLELLKTADYEAVVPVAAFAYPIQRALQIGDNDRLSMVWPENYNARSQDLPHRYHDAGQFYWIKTETLLSQKRFFVDNARALVLPPNEVQDIDTADDWQLAELKYRLSQG
ncbi:MAG: pseudaminic acid cytidylyltransferase [Cyanobacteria bacterium SZAS LIN-3]|nr:pseudaminic acid cytidylyltransferase [Cyanobacteria bacterium SZAS LIN-3]